MGVYLYCVAPAGSRPPERLRGLDGAPVRSQDVGVLSAWFSCRDARPEATVARIREHHAVVQAAVACATPVPVRFGEWLGGPGPLAERLEQEQEHLVGALTAVAGALEYALCITELAHGLRSEEDLPSLPDRSREDGSGRADEEPSGVGRAYLRALARGQRCRQGLARRRVLVLDDLRGQVGPYLRRECVAPLDAPGGLASVAHLVDRAADAAYREAVGGFVRRSAGLCVEFMGPWPPYSFAS